MGDVRDRGPRDRRHGRDRPAAGQPGDGAIKANDSNADAATAINAAHAAWIGSDDAAQTSLSAPRVEKESPGVTDSTIAYVDEMYDLVVKHLETVKDIEPPTRPPERGVVTRPPSISSPRSSRPPRRTTTSTRTSSGR